MLRPYQQQALEAMKDSIKHGLNPVADIPTGGGKSHVLMGLAEWVVDFPNKRCLILAHRKELLEQNSQKTNHDVAFYSAGLGIKDLTSSPIIIAGIQSIYKLSEEALPTINLLIVDECFTGDTIIATNKGQARIDSVSCGDIIYTATGFAKIAAKSVKKSNIIYTISLSNGTKIKCTGDHPFLSSSGWIEAKNLERNSEVFCLQDMPMLWERISTANFQKREGSVKGSICQNKVLLDILFKEDRKCNVDTGCKGKTLSNFKKNWASAISAWWKWERINKTSIDDVANDGHGLEAGISNSHKDSQENEALSNLLQSGCGESEGNESNRSGWRKPRREEKDSRPEERQLSSFVRVENIEIEEQGGGTLVYNIRTDGHPSYFANGILVHNCHRVPHEPDSMFMQLIAKLLLKNPKMRIAGFTATPYNLAPVFNHTAYSIGIGELIEQGFLCPLKSRISNHTPNLEPVPIVLGDYVVSKLGEAMMDKSLVAETIKNIMWYGQNHYSWLIFCVNVKHTEVICEAIREQGIFVEMLTGETPSEERASILERFKSREIQCLVNCEVLTTGFDAPNVDMLVMLRPTQSRTLYVQMVGRACRKHLSISENYKEYLEKRIE